MEQQPVLAHAVSVRFFMPPPELAPYISTYYLTEVALDAGQRIEDRLHPEWGNLRISVNDSWEAAVGADDLRRAPHFIAAGPTSHASRFVTGSMRSWGIGLLPLGWARLVRAPASDYADRFCDGATDPAFAGFAALETSLFVGAPDPAAEAALINRHLLAMLADRPAADDEARILRAHSALTDDSCRTVADLAARTGISARSLERFSLRAFGFSPKLLLRRQRFLRSLGQFMIDPSLSWVSMLDGGYVDQAHFVRDFRRFMGMSPSRYAALPHPVLGAAARARQAAAGAAMQVLHRP